MLKNTVIATATAASRLARNGRDWHTLLEFCGLVETVIIDEDGVYDPRMPNDRLLLGMKGTMSEMETSMFRQRSMEATKQKARRGELFLTVAVGYEKTGDDRIEKTPDRGVRDAIELVFSKFVELQTVRQVLVWMRQEQIRARSRVCCVRVFWLRSEAGRPRNAPPQDGPNPYISHYLCMIGQICDETRLLFCRCGMPWHLETRECLNDYLTTKVAKRSRWARG